MATTLPNFLLNGVGPASSIHQMVGVGLLAAADTPPVAANDSATAFTGKSETVSVLSNDAAAAPAVLNTASVVVSAQPTNGTAVAQSNGTIVYTPDNDFVGGDSFTYHVFDSEFVQSNTATVTTTVDGVTLSGTITTADEQHVRAGGRTIVLTVSGDTWVSGASFDAARQALIDGLDSAQSELLGWNNEVRDKMPVTDVVRTSDTVVTITLSAAAAYDITATETITADIPGVTALTGAPENQVFASPSFSIDLFTVGCTLSGTIIGSNEDDIVAGGKTIVLTLTGDDRFDPEPNWSFGPARQQIINNLLSDGSETFGWNAEVRDKEVITAVVRTSDTVVTITLSAAAAYDITANETITSTIPAIAFERNTLNCSVTPTFTITPTGVVAKVGGIGGKYYLETKRRRRRVMIDGQLYTVWTKAEERALLARYLENQRDVLETAEEHERKVIQVRIRRAEKRLDKAQAAADIEAEETRQKLARLIEEDDEILALLVLH